MRKLLLIIIAVLGCVIAHAETRVLLPHEGTIATGAGAPTFECEVSEADNLVTLSYHLDSLRVSTSPYNSNWDYILIPGFGLNETQGEAAIPCRVEHFSAMNPTQRYVVDNVRFSFVDIPFVYSPAIPPIMDFADSITVADIQPITAYNGFYPNEPVSFVGEQTYRGQKVQRLYLRPIQYNSATHTVRVNYEMQVTLRKETVRPTSASFSITQLSPNISEDDMVLAHTCRFFDYLKLDTLISTQVDKHYLILTHTDFVPQAQRLLNWKKECGFSCSIASRDTWSQVDVEWAIRNCIQQHPNLYYVLLVGDHTKIAPHAQRIAPLYSWFEQYYTDFPYSCLDGVNDFFPDLCIGRIPCATIEECQNAINKTLSYESCQTSVRNPSKAYFSTFFQDRNLNGEEDCGYTFHTERLYQYHKKHFDITKRIYSAVNNVNPEKWSCFYTYDDPYLPLELRRTNFPWDGNKTHIVSAFNQGCDLFFHRDHGDITGWVMPEFVTEDLSMLSNTIFPIVFSIDCSTGQYDQPACFARNMMNMSTGSSAILAAHQPSNSIRNDALSLGLFNSIWHDSSLDFTGNFITNSVKLPGAIDNSDPTPSLGEMLISGMQSVEEKCWFIRTGYIFNEVIGPNGEDLETYYHREIYHLFGDPSIYLHWDTRDVCKAVHRVESTDTLKVEFYEGNAVFGLYDPITGESHRYYGNSLSYACSDPSAVKVKIFGQGMKTINADHSVLTPQHAPSHSIIELESVKISNGSLTVKVKQEGEPGNITSGGILEFSCVNGFIASQELTAEVEEYIFQIPNNLTNSRSLGFITLRAQNQTCQTIKVIL